MAMRKYRDVEQFFDELERDESELRRLREIINSTALNETLKWSFPCYTYQGKNVLGLGGFKSYFGLWFFQGALLSDPQGVLINAQEGKTAAMRQWRMSSKQDIKVRAIKAYIKEAVELVEQSKAVQTPKKKTLTMPDLLLAALKKNQQAKKAFDDLTPGRQREYADYVSEAKRAETKIKRVTKIIPMITAGRGLHDKYKNC